MYLLVYIAVSDMEMKREAGSNDVTECSLDYKPTVGMFAVIFSVLSSYLSVYHVSTLFFYHNCLTELATN